MENIYHTIRGKTKSPRTLESNSKDPYRLQNLIFLEDEHYGRIHCKFHFFSSARKPWVTVCNSQASSFEHGHATAADFQTNLSFPFPSFPFLSLPFPSFPFLSLPFPSFPVLSLPCPSFLIPVPSVPFLSLAFPFFLSRMCSKGSCFTLGVWGLRVCSLDVAQPSATVRNRPRDCYMAVPRVASFRVAGVTFRRVSLGITY